MGIQLDWEVETERERVRSSSEDPDARSRRARAWRRLLLFTFLLVASGAAVVGAVMLRLQQVDAQLRQNLIATVENEVAALRVGDRAAFSAIQRSESDVWLQQQQATYDAYQMLKMQPDVTLTGRVLDVTIDGTRARVIVEEIAGGVQVVRTWFYWRYEDGWRHVPADYTFWGDARTLTAEPVTLNYWSMDEPYAAALGAQLPEWLRAGCGILGCAVLPPLAVQIVPDEALAPGWAADNPWLLRLPSPYTGLARLDAPFTAEAQNAVAALLAEKLVAQETANLQPVFPTDAAYLRQAIISWLVKRFTGQETNAFSIDSLAVRYGERVVGRLAAALQPDSNVGVLAEAAGVAGVDQLDIDWRDYLTWRLTLEQTLIAERDDVNILSLYDTDNPVARDLAIDRFAAGAAGERWVVTAVIRDLDAAAVPILNASASVTAADGTQREATVVFRLVDGIWKRAS